MINETKKPTTVKEWEKVCTNLDSALKVFIQSEAELIVENEKLQKEIEDLNITITKSAGIINYLEHKLDRANSV